MEHFGLLSIIPPLMAIGLAFMTKQVLPSLFVSIWVGSTILMHGNVAAGFSHMTVEYIAGSIADPWNAAIIVINITLGGMIGIISKSGGMKAVAEALGKRARTANGGQLVTYAMGIVIFFDDYANTLLVGNTMRPLCDKLKISREKLAYICDSTAAPVASIAPLSTWTAYQMGLVHSSFGVIKADMNTYEAFLRSVPYSFYGIFTLIFVLLVGLLGRDFGPMLTAERRARTTGKLLADGATPLASRELTHMKIKKGIPLRWFNAAIPIATVVIMIGIGLYIDGRASILAGGKPHIAEFVRNHPYSITTFAEIIGAAHVDYALMWSVFTGTIVAIGLVILQGILTLHEAMDAWVDGAKSMVIALLIIVFAWAIGSLCKDLGTARFLVGVLEGRMSPALIPPAVFLVGCVIAFSTGTSYGTMAIIMPIAVPLAYYLGGSELGPLLFATIGATLTGSVFGDHCSPISDTTIMSSMATASDHLDHVKTQAPYAVVTAVAAVLLGFVPVGFGIPPLVSIAVGTVALYCVVRYAGKRVEHAG